MNLFNTINSIVRYALIGIISVPFFIMILLLIPLYNYSATVRHMRAWLFYWWSRIGLFITGLSYQIKGLENLDIIPNEPCVLVMNHTSSLDIPLIEILMGGFPRFWMVLHRLQQHLFLGHLIKWTQISVDQDDIHHAGASVLRSIRRLKKHGEHLMLFPEGGRYADGKIHEFFPGFARIARILDRPVVPIAIQGACRVLVPGQTLFDSSHPITLTIGPVLRFSSDASTDSKMQEKKMVDQIREWLSSAVE